MGKKDRCKKKGKGAEKTASKTDKKLKQKNKKELAAIGEVLSFRTNISNILSGRLSILVSQDEMLVFFKIL